MKSITPKWKRGEKSVGVNDLDTERISWSSVILISDKDTVTDTANPQIISLNIFKPSKIQPLILYLLTNLLEKTNS